MPADQLEIFVFYRIQGSHPREVNQRSKPGFELTNQKIFEFTLSLFSIETFSQDYRVSNSEIQAIYFEIFRIILPVSTFTTWMP